MTKLKTSPVRGAFCISWLICAGVLTFRDWDPQQLHYLTLFFRETPLFFLDISAAFQKIFSDGLRQLCYVAVLLLAAAGAGRLALSRCRLPVSGLSRCLIFIALGFAVLSYGTFVLGILHLYNSAGAIIAGACLALFAGAGLWPLRSQRAVYSALRITLYDTALIFALAIIAAFLFAKALLPAIDIDAIAYHLGLPNFFLQEGRLQYVAFDMYSAFPFFTEMLYMLAMLVEGQKSAQCIGVVFLFAIALAGYCLMKTMVGRSCAQVTALVLFSAPCFMQSSLLSGTDLSLTFYVLMCLLCFFSWRLQHRSMVLLVLTGVFAGVCLSIKYTALVLVPGLLAAGFVADAFLSEGRLGVQLLKRAAICAAAAAVVFLPWCLKNFVATGNPLYPALYPILGGADMSPEVYEAINRLAYTSGTENFFSSVLQKTGSIFLFTPRLFSLCGPLGNAGLTLLFFIPVVPLLRKVPSVIQALCAFAALLLLSWAAFSGIIRFFYPGIALLLIISCYAMACITDQIPGFLKPFAAGAAALCVVLNCGMGFYQANMQTKTYGVDMLQETDEAYLYRHMATNPQALLDSYPAICYINKHIGRDACVLIIGDVQHLYIKRRHRYTYLSATTPYGPFKDFAGNHKALNKALKKSGITHILFNAAELLRLQNMGVVAWPRENFPLMYSFLKSPYIRQLYVNKSPGMEVVVYKLL